MKLKDIFKIKDDDEIITQMKFKKTYHIKERIQKHEPKHGS